MEYASKRLPGLLLLSINPLLKQKAFKNMGRRLMQIWSNRSANKKVNGAILGSDNKINKVRDLSPKMVVGKTALI